MDREVESRSRMPRPYHYQEPTGGAALFPVSAFSAFHLLRNYNYLLPEIPKIGYHHNERFSLHDVHEPSSPKEPIDLGKTLLSGLPPHPIISPNLFGYHHSLSPLHPIGNTSPHGKSALGSESDAKRHRGEKKPIPEEQKDEKYFERRRRNNQAAKKSRDARKIREDQIALRATILEHENAILKAQILTLREEATSLRQMLMEKKATEITIT
ncbi:PREDICTED: cell death specification protein 2 [Nicrophorus vespilloides]|uniref:Cell death specification protein 2 n=1 Tax=Nicrophorus vespilloides TaxID=110193 RepID=A0ABM1N8Y1_NICVS|nr:PREDICTED: cell death specification protein 2 [Nicrophorus vespilloides]